MEKPRTFTEGECNQIRYEDGIWCEEQDRQIYETIKQRIISFDTEKSSSDVEFIIRELATGKYFRGVLLDSGWHGEGEYNSKVIWEEVKPKIVTKTTYIKIKNKK